MDLKTLNHVCYPKFNNHYDEKTIKWLKRQLETYPAETQTFFATEKLHGSNFSIYTDGKGIKCARRNGFLEEKENFHQANIIAEALKPKIIDLYNCLCTEFDKKDDFILILFGEVTGERVQLGISYGENALRFFDICIYKSESSKFIEHKEFMDLCQKFELETVPVMASGTLDEMLKLNPEFDSKVLGKSGNTAEGMVLKFCKETSTNHGDDCTRLMIKFKCKKFDEIAYTPKKKGTVVVDDSDLEFLSSEFESRLTFSRLQAVKSKLNQKQAKNREIMSKSMFEDASEDMEEASRKKMLENEVLIKRGQLMTRNFVGTNILILNFSNEEFTVYKEKIALVEKFSMENFEELKGGDVDIGSVKDAIKIFLELEGVAKVIQNALNSEIMQKARGLVGKS